MARYLGIDIDTYTVRAALLRTRLGGLVVEKLVEETVREGEDSVAALRRLGVGLPGGLPRPDGLAAALPGGSAFQRKVELPGAAVKELSSVLVYELESQVPIDMADAVFDWRLPKKLPKVGVLPIFAVVARAADVREHTSKIHEATRLHPDHVSAGALPLANLITLFPDLERVVVEREAPPAAPAADATPGSPVGAGGEAPLGASPLAPQPLGVQPLGVQPLEAQPLGAQPLGAQPTGISGAPPWTEPRSEGLAGAPPAGLLELPSYELDDAPTYVGPAPGLGPAPQLAGPVASPLAPAPLAPAPLEEVLGPSSLGPSLGPGPLAPAPLAAPSAPARVRETVVGPVLLVDVGDLRTDVCVLSGGEPTFVRTLSRGVVGLPETAAVLARDVKQTLAAYRVSGGEPIVAAYLVGRASGAPGAEGFFRDALGVPVLPLPAPKGPKPKGPLELEIVAALPRFAKAVGLALSFVNRVKSINLRTGSLEAEQGYPFLREKLPILVGLGTVAAASFAFSVLAEGRSLRAQRAVAELELGNVSAEILGERTVDPERARALIEAGGAGAEDDPLPRADAFDVMVQLSKAVPKDVVHDVVELEVQRGHVTIQGAVPSLSDAQGIADKLKQHRCFRDMKGVRTSQFAENRQKYVIEFDIRCEDKKKAGVGAAASASAAGPKATAGPRTEPKKDATKKDGER
jgi:general secretion pathway protein L